MKKIIVFLILIIFLSGCSAKYDLVYKDGLIKESISAIGVKEEYIDEESFESVVNQYYNDINFLTDKKIDPGDMSEEEYLKIFSSYNKELINNKNYGIKYYYDFDNIDDYLDSRILNTFYSNIEFDNKHIYVSEPKNIYDSYPYLDNITITFKTDKMVSNTNADKIKNNTYYWNIDRSNYATKIISIDFTSNILDTIKPIGEKKSNIVVDIFIAIICIILLLGIVKVYDRIKKSNK